jgi:hypothetical protein
MARPKKKATKRPAEDSYKEFEKKCDVIRTENAKLLTGFVEWLASKGLSASTITNHHRNAGVYLNTYLLYVKPIKARDGASHAYDFLGYWFIRKCLWATPTSMKSLAASIKKFYAFMAEKGEVSQDAYDDLREIIKYELPDWLNTLHRYDSGDNPFRL